MLGGGTCVYVLWICVCLVLGCNELRHRKRSHFSRLMHSVKLQRVYTLLTSKFRRSTPHIGRAWRGQTSVRVRRHANRASLGALGQQVSYQFDRIWLTGHWYIGSPLRFATLPKWTGDMTLNNPSATEFMHSSIHIFYMCIKFIHQSENFSFHLVPIQFSSVQSLDWFGCWGEMRDNQQRSSSTHTICFQLILLVLHTPTLSLCLAFYDVRYTNVLLMEWKSTWTAEPLGLSELRVSISGRTR